MEELQCFDNSMISAYKRCPRYFMYRHQYHLAPETGDAKAFILHFGTAWHAAMDKHFVNDDPTIGDIAFLNVYKPYANDDPSGLRTVANGLHALKAYRKQYPMDKSPFEVVMVETGFAVGLGDIVYCGRIDKICKWTMGFEGLLIIDHKTSARKGYLNLKPNAAMEGYVWGASELIGEPIYTAMLDQTYFRKNKPPELIREITQRTTTELEEWKKDTLEWVSRINSHTFPKNDNNCLAYGKVCEYRILCNCQDKNQRENLMSDLYKIDKWEPWEMGE